MSTSLQTADAGSHITNASRPARRRVRAVFYRHQETGGQRIFTLRRVLRLLGALTVVAVVATTSAFAYLYTQYSKVVDARLASGYLTSRAGLYAAPRTLREGQSMTAARLAEVLRRAGYVEGEASRIWNGRFKVENDAVEIFPSDAPGLNDASGASSVRVEFDRRGRVSKIRGDGLLLDSYTLAPEPLTIDAAEKTSERAALTYEEIPEQLRRAVLAIEDRRFFEHGAVDLWGVARAAFSWSDEAQELKQGGSTITQQLVKNTYLTPERTLQRKFREAALASVLENRLSKQDIFALYCNEIYLGQRGSIAVRGVRQAARIFFGKELKDLSLAEAATIAGMIQSPGRYAPDRHPDNARTRRNVVLAGMLRDGSVNAEQARTASAEPVAVAPLERADATAPYFIDYVSREVESRLVSEEEGQNLRVYTTLDLDLQRIAEEAVGRQVEQLEKVFKGKRRPQAALVALDPRSGHVLAMVGGRSYAESQLNRATDARRQPGSVFKPVVYAAALESGLSPLTLSSDAPREFKYDVRASYRPANYGGRFSMRDVTLRTGLVRSLNVVTVDVAMRTGLTRVATLAERLGLPRPKAYPALALGTAEATPLEVATAYTALAGAGRRTSPAPLLRVEGGSGNGFNPDPLASEQVLKPATAYMLTDMLSAVIDHGTARAARGAFKGTAVAGKTGTSRDGWFAGYTPNLICVVWVGFDDGGELDLTGANAALPAWTEFVKRAVDLRPELGGAEFARPGSIAFVDIDPETGLVASPSCPLRERVALAPTFVPDHECSLHGDPWGLMALAASSTPTELTPTAQVEAPSVSTYDTRATRTAYAQTEPTRTAETTEEYSHAFKEETQATRVEVGRDGRRRLTNDMSVTSKATDGWQEQ